MPIVNLTHNENGSVRLRRSVTRKIAIGLPPDAGKNFPQKLDHFVFQKKEARQVEYYDETSRTTKKRTEVIWVPDEELHKRYGEHCKEIWIVLLDDDPDVAIRTELAWWTKTARICSGDGEKAIRRSVTKPEGAPYQPCANHGCNEWASGICKPSGDLYFILADYPTLGTICKLHTTSFQSIAEIRSALEDLRSVTGGRLMGVRVKLTVRIEKNVFTPKKAGAVRQTSTKYVVGLQLDAADVRQLTASLSENMALFENVKLRLGTRSVVIEEDPDAEAAPSMAAEFYPASSIKPAAAPQRATTIDATITPNPAPAAPAQAQAPATGPITDADLPGEMFEQQDMTPWLRSDASEFYAAWTASGWTAGQVSTFLKDTCEVDSSLRVPRSKKTVAMKWAKTRPPAPPLAPQTPLELECREIMATIGLNLTRQMAVIDENKGDWAAIRKDLNSIADEEAR